jgi:hypothetical protein
MACSLANVTIWELPMMWNRLILAIALTFTLQAIVSFDKASAVAQALGQAAQQVLGKSVREIGLPERQPNER